MDPITQISQKLLAERARQTLQHQLPPPETSPPPYTPSDSDSDADSDDETDDLPSSPLKLTINAAHSIRGNNNLVPTSPTPLADATKFSTLLLHSLNQINNAAGPSRRLKVDLTINCGITVIGDRNVIGNVGLRPKPAGGAEVAAVVGAKRKAEEDPEEEREAKKTEVENA